MHLSIRLKVLLGFGISVLVTVVVSFVSIGSLRKSHGTVKAVAGEKTTYLRLVEESKITALQLRRYEKDFFLNIGNSAEQEKYIGKLNSAMDDGRSLLDSISIIASGLSLSPHTDTLIMLSKRYMIQYMKDVKHVIEHINGNDVVTPQDANKLMTAYKVNIHSFENTIDTLKNSGIALLAQTAMEENRNSRYAIRMLLATIGASILGIIAFALFFAAGIARPVTSVVAMLKDISEGEGDLTRRLKVASNDEIGELAGYFNKFIEKLQTLISTVVGNADTVASSATEFSTVATQIAANTEEMSAQTTTVASATQQATANVTTMSSVASAMSDSTNSVATAIEEMSASLNEVARNCQNELNIAAEAGKHAASGKEVMDKLGTAAQSIGKVIELINSIADQTNLLAINATIEAASAGDAGRGFAVVANEVKELAKQTAQATLEIQKQVEDIQVNTSEAVKAIDSVATVIKEVNSISQTIVSAVEEQSATVNEIAGSVTGVSTGAQEVARNLAESGQRLSVIAGTVNGVSGAVSETAGGITQVKSSAGDLARISENLKKLLSQFKV